jgi:hypothetical protein
MTAKITYEQAVYGSFPTLQKGYRVLARSTSCTDTWLDALQRTAQRFGERPAGVAEYSCLFALPLPRGPWMVVGVFPTGSDDCGRPGALGFHGLFVSRWMYFKAGSSPFALAGALRRQWDESDVDATLPAGAVGVPTWSDASSSRSPPVDVRIGRIVAAMKQKRRVVVSSAQPIDELAREVWRELPVTIRRRASVATWAFSNDNCFDLVALPRLSAVVSDGCEVIIQSEMVDQAGRQADEGWPSDGLLGHAETQEGRVVRGAARNRRGV